MELQEIFNTVHKHLLTQGCKSQKPFNMLSVAGPIILSWVVHIWETTVYAAP